MVGIQAHFLQPLLYVLKATRSLAVCLSAVPAFGIQATKQPPLILPTNYGAHICLFNIGWQGIMCLVMHYLCDTSTVHFGLPMEISPTDSWLSEEHQINFESTVT